MSCLAENHFLVCIDCGHFNAFSNHNPAREIMMRELVKIDDEVISEEEFIKILKLSNEYPYLIEKVIKNKVTVHAAKKRDIKLSDEELQEAADIFRSAQGLHRAKETQEWMNDLGISIEDFENFIAERLYRKKIIEAITTEDAVETYFKLNSPQFETADIKVIVTDNEEKAKELKAILDDDPDSFDELVREYSLDDQTREIGGQIKGIRRGELREELTAKIFNAASGDIIGPFRLNETDFYEIILVTTVHPTKLDDSTRVRITDAIYDQWLKARFEEHTVKKR